MKLIPLSKGKFAKCDDENYELVSHHRWYENEGYAITYQKGKRIRMHRLIMNAPDGVDVDHRDHDKLNNQKSNLRLCTLTQNNQNGKLRKDNTSGYKGVSLDRSTGHWRALMYANGQAHYSGQFLEKHHAALAYDLWAIDLHGEFASTNFSVVAFGS
jgi:HNH endonuclease/AP2 domain